MHSSKRRRRRVCTTALTTVHRGTRPSCSACKCVCLNPASIIHTLCSPYPASTRLGVVDHRRSAVRVWPHLRRRRHGRTRTSHQYGVVHVRSSDVSADDHWCTVKQIRVKRADECICQTATCARCQFCISAATECVQSNVPVSGEWC
jgi:hypothetical protein